MSNAIMEKSISKIVSTGLAAVTVVVFTQSVTDPVNVTKLFVLGGFAFAAFGASVRLLSKDFFKKFKMPIISVGIFSIGSVVSLFSSTAPITQSFYGAYGRNNGFLLYFLLILLFIATLTIKAQPMFVPILIALGVAGIVNVVYALWVLAFGDFVGWNNPYGNLLGTLGNPNFIGSFFGMFATLLFALIAAPKTSKKIRISSILLVPFVFLGIIQSHAVQGKVLFVTSFAIVSLYWVRSRFSNPIVPLTYFGVLSVGFIFALLGTLQKGPLADILYKSTVSLRGQYWYAGWKTGLLNPFFGVGFDAFGDWYRRTRRESALTFPGVDTITNASHNVFLDIFAFGGWPLFIGYIAIVVSVLISIVRFFLRHKAFDPIFVSLSGVWLCYQLQSTISINQIGLAIWGWVFGAAIIAYEKNDSSAGEIIAKTAPSKGKKAKSINRSSSGNIFSPSLIAGLSAVVGLIIAVPPLSADTKWRNAQLSQNAKLIEEALIPSYLNPLNTFEINNVVGVFETNGLTDLAHKYALKAVQFNPDSYESWRNLYRLSKTSDKERAKALSNMKRLDPLNKLVGEIPK
jgi:hypothetical protein